MAAARIQVAIRLSLAVNHQQSLCLNLVWAVRFVDALPGLATGEELIVDRNLSALAVPVADLQMTFDFKVLLGPH